MDEEIIEKLILDQCIEKLKEISQHGPGTLEKIKMSLSLYPKLYQKLKLKAQREYEFHCSLDPNQVPSISAKWYLDEKLHPAVSATAYCSFKHQVNKGQQGNKTPLYAAKQKNHICDNFTRNSGIYICGVIKKSYGTTVSPAVIYFRGNMPRKQIAVGLLD